MTTAWAFLLGSDSLVAGVALAPLVSPRARWILAAIFGLMDGLGTLLGGVALPGVASVAAGVVPFVIAAYGVYLLAVSVWARRRMSHPLIYATPVLLSIDNLVAGSIGPETILAGACVAALVSAALAMVGLGIGASVASVTGFSRERLAGVGLLVVATAALLA
jgi:hypothetical protein